MSATAADLDWKRHTLAASLGTYLRSAARLNSLSVPKLGVRGECTRRQSRRSDLRRPSSPTRDLTAMSRRSRSTARSGLFLRLLLSFRGRGTARLAEEALSIDIRGMLVKLSGQRIHKDGEPPGVDRIREKPGTQETKMDLWSFKARACAFERDGQCEL